jgi:hypothetical protein
MTIPHLDPNLPMNARITEGITLGIVDALRFKPHPKLGYPSGMGLLGLS